MKGLIFALALIVGISAYRPYFEPQHEYLYEYDSAVLSNLPDVAHQYVGMRIKSEILIQKLQDQKIFMMDKIQIGRIHDKILTTDPEHISWTYGSAGELEAELKRPVQWVTEKGKFIEMFVDKEESVMATNIKKAIISLLQLRIDPANPSYHSPGRPHENRGNYVPRSQTEGSHVSVEEDGISGKCQTEYMVDSSPSGFHPDKQVYNITKIRNYENCTSRPSWILTNHLAYDCMDCEADDVHPLQTVTVIEADMYQKGESYLLEELVCKSQTTFNPLSAIGDNVLTNHSQTLRFVATQQISKKLPIPASSVPHRSLEYIFPDAHKYLPGPPSLKQRPPAHGIPYIGDPIPRAKKALDEMSKKIHSDDLVKLEEATYSGPRLIFHMRSMSFDEIKQVFPVPESTPSTYEDTPESVKRSLFLQVLPMVGTGPSVMYIKELILSGKIKGETATQIVMALGKYILEPTGYIITEIMTLAESPVVMSNPQMWKAAWLTVASLVYQACAGAEDSPTRPLPPYLENYCKPNEEDKYIYKFGDMLKKSKGIPEKLLFIRVIGRAGLPGGLEHLTPIVKGFQPEVDAVRRAAMFSLIRLARSGLEDQVYELIERVFYDTDEPTSVRQAALIVLFKAQPDYSDLQKLAAWSWTEPEDQVSSLIYSHFAYLANTSHPCMSSLSSDAKSLLPFVEEADYGIQVGQFWEISDYDDDYGIGAQLHGSYIGSNNSFIPDHGRMAMNWTLAGYSSRLFTLSYNSHNMQSFLDRYLGPVAAVGDVDRKSDIFDINQKLKIASRDQDPWFLSVMLTLMNSKSRMLYLSDNDVSDLFKSGLIPQLSISDVKQGFNVDIMKYTSPLEFKSHLPLESGLPVLVRISTPMSLRIKGKVTMKVESSDYIHSSVPSSAIIKTDLKISAAMIVRGSLGVIDIFEKKRMAAGVSLSTAVKAPVSTEIKYQVNKGSIKFSLKPSLTNPVPPPHKLMIYKVHPVTMAAPIFAEIPDISSYKTIHSNPKPDKFEVDLNRESLGFPFRAKVVSERDFTDLGSYLSDWEDQSWMSIANFFWLSPEFKYHTVELHLIDSPAVNREIELLLNVTYSPTYSEQMYLDNNHQNNITGLWGYWRGWARFPEKCVLSQSYNAQPDYDDSSKYGIRMETDYSKYPKGAGPKDYDYVSKYEGKIDYDDTTPSYSPYPSYDRSPSSYSSSGSTSRRVTKIPRRPEVRKVNVKLIIQTTQSSEAKFLTDTYFERDYDRQKDKFTSSIVLQKIPFLSTEMVQICVAGVTKYPEVQCDDIAKINPGCIPPIDSTFNVKWGSTCPLTPQITGTIKLEQSKEQIEFQHKSGAWYMGQCKKDISMGLKDSYACDLSRNEMSSYNKMTMQLSYANLPAWLWNVTTWMDNYLKYKLYNHMSYNPIEVNNGEGKLKITAKVYNEMPVVNLKVYKPKENVFFHKVYYEDWLPYTYTISAVDTVWEQFWDDVTGEMETPSCTVSKQYIDQFDNNTIYYPLNSCYHLVAKDCTDDKLFAVLMANSDNYKILKMDLVGWNITVWPTGGSFEAIIDGQKYAITPGEVILVRSPAKKGDKIIAYISQMGKEVFIQAPGLTLTVVYDGEQSRVELSNFWRGKLCGLCGEFSGDSDEAFVGPKQCIYADSVSYGLSYAIPSERCSLPPPPYPDKICKNPGAYTYGSYRYGSDFYKSEGFRSPGYEDFIPNLPPSPYRKY